MSDEPTRHLEPIEATPLGALHDDFEERRKHASSSRAAVDAVAALLATLEPELRARIDTRSAVEMLLAWEELSRPAPADATDN